MTGFTYPRPQKSKASCSLILFVVVAAIAAVTSIALIFSSSLDNPKFSSIFATGDKDLRVPHTFKARPEFNDLTAEGNDLWDSIIPKNGGFILRRKGKVWDVGGVSMFHQLHCLQMIRAGIQDLQNENKQMKRSPHGGEHEHGSSNGMNDTIHWAHCLDYLMQVSSFELDQIIYKLMETGDIVRGR